MRLCLVVIAISTGLNGCGKKIQENSKIAEMAIQDLVLNEIVHDSLTADQIQSIEKIQKVFSEVNTSSLEETIENFKRDQNPDNEITIWLKMADAYERFTLRQGRTIEYNKKNEAYELILLRSMMTEGEVLDKLKFEFLTKDEVEEIFGYYLAPPQPMKIERK